MDYGRAYQIIFFSSIVLMSAFANEFVIKKTKSPSINTIKEECCETHTALLRDIPTMMHLIADLQTESCIMIEEYLKSEKVSFCAKASKEKLVEYHALVQNCYKLCQDFKTEISATLKKINQLKNI